MKVFITGITGFAGSHLAELMLSEGHEVFGASRWRSKMENIEHISQDIHLINADIRDGYSMANAFSEIMPDYCFHLAAQSFVLESWKSPLETMSTNISGTVNVLEAVKKVSPNCIVHIAGSSEEYGLVHPEESPITEDNPLRPMSPYGVSKVATDKLGCLYHMSYGLQVVVTRAFNHSGPRRGDVFATSNFAKQIVQIENMNYAIRDSMKELPAIHVGNLDAERDFSDARDIVRAYWLAATKGKAGEVYNICSGVAWKISTMLDMLLEESLVKIQIVQDPNRMRPSDVPVLLGNCDKFKALTGWQPQIPFFKQTLSDLLDYWREKLR